jgi:hypothetical protein
MSAWASHQLRKIGAAEELDLASVRRDGTLRNPVTMWVVPHGDCLYVRSVNGRTSSWFRGAQSRREANPGRRRPEGRPPRRDGRRQRRARRRLPHEARALRSKHHRLHHEPGSASRDAQAGSALATPAVRGAAVLAVIRRNPTPQPGGLWTDTITYRAGAAFDRSKCSSRVVVDDEGRLFGNRAELPRPELPVPLRRRALRRVAEPPAVVRLAPRDERCDVRRDVRRKGHV